jgi:N-acetylglutamate synthase-like GNAT family acetyltransferase
MSCHPRPAVALATENELSYVLDLQKKNCQALGFLTRAALEEKIRLRRIWLARENDEPAGYLNHGSLAGPEVRIFQAAIQYDAQRRYLGLALLNDLAARAAAAGARGISLRCLSFLEANAFWQSAGFTLAGAEPGAKGTLNVWTKLLPSSPAIPHAGDRARTSTSHSPDAITFSSRFHACPRCGQLTTDTWTRGARRHALCATCVRLASRN